jgi:hypothetical protein
VCGLVKGFIYSVTVERRVAMWMMKRVRWIDKEPMERTTSENLCQVRTSVGVGTMSQWDSIGGTRMAGLKSGILTQ